jgi:RND family efflux transporter MFP subunit
MRYSPKATLPLIVLAVGIVGMVVLILARPKVETRPRSLPPPLVRVVEVEPQDIRLTVSSQGTAVPHKESTFVAEVPGKVVWTSESLVDGGFFEEGDVLLRIDPTDYELAVTRNEAQVAQAELRLMREEAEAGVARKEWEELGEGDGHPLTLREPQVAEARAAFQAARAALAQAQQDLKRTKVRAPFAGRVRQKMADVGQFVNRGTPVAAGYSIDVAEVRLPLPDAELAYLDLPLHYRGSAMNENGPKARFTALFGGERYEWDGRVVRTEGEIDPKSRMVHVVARVEDPYGRRGGQPDRPPLSVGIFLDARIEGRVAEKVVVLPRAALRGRDTVWVVDEDSRLRFRQVEVLKTDPEEVIIEAGLEYGERVCLSALDAAVDGMKVRTLGESEADSQEPRREAAG